MAILPLDESIPRFQANEDRINVFANGDANADMQTSGGQAVPSIRKIVATKTAQIDSEIALLLGDRTDYLNGRIDDLIDLKNGEINVAADGVLAGAVAARNKAALWAENDVDAEVEAGKFSAKHYAAKSAEERQQVAADLVTFTELAETLTELGTPWDETVGAQQIKGADAAAIIEKLGVRSVADSYSKSELYTKSEIDLQRIKFIGAGSPLPSSDEGPIWHASYASVLTWQTFNANGAAYVGYASINIGSPQLDSQGTPRAGWLKRNGGSYSKTAYAPLWNWALHNGRVVTLGSWAAGAFVFADNGDGTFRLPDNRGEFERIWDDGRGIDSGRAIGSSQLDQMQQITGSLARVGSNRVMFSGGSGALSVLSGNDSALSAGNSTNSGLNGNVAFDSANSPGARAGSETRPRNVALLGTIKF